MADLSGLEERLAVLERRFDEFTKAVPADTTSQSTGHPASRVAGIWKDHPDIAELRSEIEQYRERADVEWDDE